MSNDTQSTGSSNGSTPNGRTPSWAPPGEGWVGSGAAGQQHRDAHGSHDPYRAAPTGQQTAQQPGAQQTAPQVPVGPYAGGQQGQGGQHGQPVQHSAYAGTPYGGTAPYAGTPYGGGTATADRPGETPWYGTPTGPDGGGDGTGSTPGGRKHRKGPGWGGVVAVAAIAALLGSGIAFAAARGMDQTAPALAATTSGGSGGSGGSSASGSAGSVPVGTPVDWGTVAQRVEPSVVTIQVSDGQTGGEGTGIIFDTEGHVVTNNHVATAATGSSAQIRIILSDGRVYQGKIAGTDPATDLAVIQIENAPNDLTPATFGNSDDVKVGENVMAIGNPLGLSDTVTTGIISATDRPVTTQASESQQSQADPFGFNRGQQTQPDPVVTNALQTDAAINPGNSGGPLVNGNGEVLGINSSIASTSDGSGQAGSIGLGFAIPGNEVKRVATELVQDGSAQHARLGVELGQDGTATVDGTTRQAAVVANVPSGTAAEQAGIKAGDAITAVDGDAVSGAESLTAQIRSRAPGQQVQLTVVRDGKQQTITATLGTAPSSSQG